MQGICFRHVSCPVCRKLVALVSSESLYSWLCVKSDCRMIRQVICRYASVFCILSYAVHCCRGLTNSLEKEVAHKPTTTLRQLLTNVKDRDEPNNRQGAVYKIKCSDCQASYIGETGRNLNTRLTEHKRATRNGDANNHIAVHHQLTNHNIDWDSAQCLTYSTNYFQRLTLESWYTNLEQTPLNRCQQLPPPYKRLIHDRNETDKRTSNRPT